MSMSGNAGDVYPAALEKAEKQHVVGHQPAQRQHLRGEEVGPSQQRQMDPNEAWRCRTLPTVWSQTLYPRLANTPAIRS
jgi:hypothetical protein